MSFPGVVVRALGWLARSPTIWLYGLLAALLGWANLPVAFLAAATRSAAFPLGGAFGAVALAALCLPAVWSEVAAIRALSPASRPSEPAALAAVRRLPGVAGFYVAMGITAMLVAIAVVFSLTWLFSTVAGVLVTFLTLGLSSVLAFALMSLSLLLPVWALTPLGLRAVVLLESGAWEGVLAAFVLFEERAALSIAGLLTALALDLALFGAGVVLNARDISLPSLLGIVAEWPGSNVAAGVVLLVLGGLAAMFKLALWSAIYAEVAPAALREVGGASEASRSPVSPRRWLSATVALARRSLAALVRTPALLVVAGLIVCIGVPGPADLLTLYRLIPTRFQSANLAVAQALVSDAGLLLLLVFPLGVIAETFLSAVLITASVGALSTRSDGPGIALGRALENWWRLIVAKIVLFVYVALTGGIVMVGGLFALAGLVVVAPGLDALGDYWTTLVITLAALAGILLIPFVARAVLLDGLSGGAAVSRAFDVMTERPLPALLVFALTLGLDVLKGPLGSLAGLLTNGWALLLALVVGARLEPPIGIGTLTASAALLGVATLVVAFKALLWTALYQHAAAGADESQPQ